MLSIYADFNNADERGRIRLNTAGSLRDIAIHEGDLAEGLTVVVYMTDEYQVLATLVRDEIWYAIPDYATITYLDNR